MLQLDPRLIANLVGKDLVAFGTGGIGKLLIPYLAQEPDIKLHGVTNSRVTAVDAGTFLDTTLPIRSLDIWKKLMPDATILLCVAEKNEVDAWTACETAGFHKILFYPMDLLDMLQAIYSPSYLPTGCPMFEVVCMANELRDIHKASFAEFKGCHRGQTVAVIATGPTLNYYSQVKGIPHIGVNSSFLKNDIHLDFYFLWHYVKEWCDALEGHDFIKFFARNEKNAPVEEQFPEYTVEQNHARRFFSGEPSREIYSDIEYHPLMGYRSVIFSALHFAIYTRPKRLLLIGCDCSLNGHYDNVPQNTFEKNHIIPVWLEGYKVLKQFAEQHYPDMEIISVNPVGLKGMFHDMYTENYLNDRSELDRAECEIFRPEDFKENNG